MVNKFLLPLMLMIPLSVHCDAQQVPQAESCLDKAETQAELNICASEESKRADFELDKTYRNLLKLVRSNTKAVNAIRLSEKAWKQYRDSYLKAMYPEKDKPQSYGSFFPMEFDLLAADLTREHIKALKVLIQQYSVNF
jgi:uncharacterized protein YecT (DUF1311 family)